MEELDQTVLSSENPSMLASVGNLSVIVERLEDIADRLKGINVAVSIIDSYLTSQGQVANYQDLRKFSGRCDFF